MTDKLPPNLIALFQPRPPLRYLPPADFAPEERRTHAVDGVAAFLPALQEKKEAEKDTKYTESHLERADRIKLEKKKHQDWLMTEGFKKLYKPSEDENIRGDAFKTLFIARLPYSATTKDLEKEFGRYGPIERVRVIQDRGEKSKKSGKSRGYAFVLFEREKDMKSAYKECEHLHIHGRRVLVDVERGRTVTGWRPRRFGGGLGGRHYTKPSIAKPSFGPPSAPGGFGRGGFRGGYEGRGGGFRGPRGGGGFRGGRGGFQNGAPDGAPSGPRQHGGGGGGGGGRSGGYGGYDDRGPRNANFEPLPPRGGGGSGGGYRDRDRDFNSGPPKRSYDGGGYDEPRQRRRY